MKNEYEKGIEANRVDYAIFRLGELGIDVFAPKNPDCIEFEWKGHIVKFFPYTGWHTGKSIKDGRGLKNLLKQLH